MEFLGAIKERLEVGVPGRWGNGSSPENAISQKSATEHRLFLPSPAQAALGKMG